MFLTFDELKKDILVKTHHLKLAIYPDSTKIYQNMRPWFWWNDMKNDITAYVSKCLTYQQVKTKYRRPGGLLQPL